uniref:Putative cellulose biosynthesis (CelD) protein n=1 Tax=Geobacter sp. (strain M21) TaxID=443144 RepID=C6DZW3_GEOSM
MSQFETEIVQDPKRLAALKPEWDALFATMDADRSVFMSHLWYDCWWRHFGKKAELFLLVLRRRGETVGIAPLMRRRLTLHGLPVRGLVFVANGNSLHNDLLVRGEDRDEVLEELARFLCEERVGWQYIELHHFPAVSPNCAGFAAALARRNVPVRLFSSYDSPFLEVRGGWQQFISSRSQRVRKTLRNIANTMERSGVVEVSEVTDWDGYMSVREDVLRIARNSWTHRVGDSLAHPLNGPFFEELAYGAAKAGWLSLWLLRLDGKAVAFEYHLRGCGKEHALRGSYDEEFHRLSPGAFLETEILKRIFSEPHVVERYDFGGSFDDYKKRWSDSSLDHATICAFNKGAYCRLAAFHELAIVDTARRLRNLWRKRNVNA